MKSASKNLPENIGAEEQDLVPEDDTVIGRAFRRSLLVLGMTAVIVVGLLLLRSRESVLAPAVETAPVPVVVPEAAPVPPPLPFTDVTREWGITFVHENGARGEKLLPETMGGGVAVLDLELDGDPDLFFVNGTTWDDPLRGPKHALYRNDGGRFVDVTEEAGLDASFYGMGAAVGDIDADGDTDLFVTAVGPNHLYRNDGGRFVDITADAEVAGDPYGWSSGAAFADLNGDQHLDLIVCNYIRWSPEIDREVDYRLAGIGRAYGPPMNFEGDVVRVYFNLGDGRFEDATEHAGLRVLNPNTRVPVAKALAVLPLDVDRDGDTDLVVSNDTVRNFLFDNRGDGTFTEAGVRSGLAYDDHGNATGAMGIDAAYYRNDESLALAIGNFANEMTSFYVSQPEAGLFLDEAIIEGIGPASRRQLTFGLFFFDVDLDGRLDLLQANGHLEEEIEIVQASQSYRQPAQLFWNTGSDRNRRFAPVEGEATKDLATPIVGRGAAYGDLDDDGDLDVIITQVAGPPLVLRNDQATGHHWLRVRLVGLAPNPDAIGAEVVLESGGRRQRQTVMPTRSYLSQVERTLTFGLGSVASVSSLRVRWPDGHEVEVPVSGVDTEIVVRR